ncbi:MAG: hypothetical protein JWP96_2191 [Polaromonas sp.]|nr:hypothetical protein [Polaromonas sp.]
MITSGTSCGAINEKAGFTFPASMHHWTNGWPHRCDENSASLSGVSLGALAFRIASDAKVLQYPKNLEIVLNNKRQ